MSEKEMKGATGKLDEDLAILFEKENSGQLEELSKVVADKNISSEEFFKRVPWGIIRLAIALAENFQYAMILQQNPSELKPKLDKARQLVQQYFADLPTHPVVIEKLIEENKEKKGAREETKEFPLNLNVISRITPISTFFSGKNKDGSENFIPAVRIGLLDRRDKVLLDTTLDWDDLLFVASGFLEILDKELDRWQSLAEQGRLSLPDIDEIEKRIEPAQKSLVRLVDLVSIYKTFLKRSKSEVPPSHNEDSK